MPTLCFGGSFNPIHLGHLRCAQAVAEKAGYDRVMLIPSGQPPHKQGADDRNELAPAADRLAMCRLATQGSHLFALSDIETRHPSPSYTIDTAQRLRQQGFNEIHWLIGADMVLYLPKWHRPLDLLREVHFVVMARPGWTIDWDSLPVEIRPLREHMVEVPQIDISSTEVRRRVREGEPIDDLVPAVVARYIAQRGLYRGE